MNYGDFKNKNGSKTNDLSFSPLLGQSTAITSSEQRKLQMSSGSEKRLKMQQQRQYYSEQYRQQQQKQHQQTANAVLGTEMYNQSSSNTQ